MPTNLQRAFRAEIALYAYSDEKASAPLRPMALYDDRQEVLTDLLCDLMHHAYLDEEMDFQAALARAGDHFAAELAEEQS
jgi:hypothetical protein